MKIKISEIENKPQKAQDIKFSEVFEEFNKDVPVQAELKVEIIDSYVKITGQVKALLNLTCDVCLKEFTKEYNYNVEEFFAREALNDSYEAEFEIKQNNFIEDLNGSDEIDITDFVYQSVILHIPNKIVCDINCNGSENLDKYLKKDFTDPRLEIFKKIKIEKE